MQIKASMETRQLLLGRRILSTTRYFREYPTQVKPFLPPETFAQPPAEFTGPLNAYGKIRSKLTQLGALQWVRRMLGLRLVMTLRHFFIYSAATPSEAHFRYLVTKYLAPHQQSSGIHTERTSASFGVNFVGYLRSENGVGQAARNLLSCAGSSGVPFTAYSIDPRSESPWTVSPVQQTKPPFEVNIISVNADQTFQIEDLLGKSFYHERYNIGYWFWELPRFPERWESTFEPYDEIWVASEFVKTSIQARTTKPVTLMPIVIEPELPAVGNRAALGLPDDAFIVLFMFDAHGTFERKNPQAVIEAFSLAFDAAERQHNVRLVIKASKLHMEPARAAELGKQLEAVNGILLEQSLTRLETNALINQCDTYISLHRSEGFGLTMAEAMYLGKPVVATDYSGNLAFMTAETGYLVPYRVVELQSHYGVYEQHNQWAEADTCAAAEYLRAIYADQEQAKRVGQRAAQHIRQQYNRVEVGQQFSDRLAAIQTGMSAPVPVLHV